MQVRTVRNRSLLASGRLDANYFCSAGTQAAERVAVMEASGVVLRPLGTEFGIARTFAPNRFSRAYASSAEEAIPYLRPYDVFEYLPQPADWLSVDRTKALESYRVSRGTVLVSCSGRNLGPAVMVDSYLAGFMLSHDMVRLTFTSMEDAAYTLAFLNCPTGQALLRRSKSGSVIDHISTSHVDGLNVPMLEQPLRRSITARMMDAFKARERARQDLRSALREFEADLPAPRTDPLRKGWSVRSTGLRGRLDVAPTAPPVAHMRDALIKLGGQPLAAAADSFIPGRYVRYYVEQEHGAPIVSGRQLLQLAPVNLRYISPRSFRRPGDYELRSGWIAMQAEGRAEERIGFPVLVLSDRDGWMANNHVVRMRPKPGVNSGSLWLALASTHTQLQVKAAATGSVVDAVNTADLDRVVLPPLREDLGLRAARAWDLLRQANEEEASAVADLEATLGSLSGETQSRV